MRDKIGGKTILCIVDRIMLKFQEVAHIRARVLSIIPTNIL